MRGLADEPAGLVTMFAFESEAFWLNVTNAVLGLAVFALCVVVAWSATQEILSSKHGRPV